MKFLKLWPIFHWKSATLSSAMIMTSLWRHTWDIVLILVCLEREDPSYTMVPITCISEVSFSSSQGSGKFPPPPPPVTKKGLVRRGLRLTHVSSMINFCYFITPFTKFSAIILCCKQKVINFPFHLFAIKKNKQWMSSRLTTFTMLCSILSSLMGDKYSFTFYY